ncbi:MAG: hypothetical protein ACRDQB_17000, partial [Thermocrispum sp.]
MTTLHTLRARTRGWANSMLVLAALMAVTGTVSVAGLLLDDRLLGGQPIWAKPFKFSVSIGLYAVAWAWLASLTTRAPRLLRWSSRTIALLIGMEMVFIIGQVLRGRASHFNNETDFDSTVFQIMGVAIGTVWVLTFVLTTLVMRSDIPGRATRSAVRLGAAISLAGIAVALLMTGPTPEQLQQLKADERPPAIGAHAVGVADGGPALPILGWSTTGGDLRIPHFVGMHALQVLPLVAMALTVLAARWPALRGERTRTRLVRIAAAGYFGLTALVTWQALRGQSIVDPDLLTLGA